MKSKLLMVIFFGLIAFVGYFGYKVYTDLNATALDTNNHLLNNKNPEDAPSHAKTPGSKPEDFYAFIVGIDTRKNSHTMNTDSMILAHVIPQANKIKLISIPRDLRVRNESGQPVKINSVFYEGFLTAVNKAKKDPSLLSGRIVQFGDMKINEEYLTSGLVNLRETLARFVDVPIEYTTVVSFDSVIQLVDAIGGIEINVKRSMQYDAAFDGTHIRLEKGLQTLDGVNALNYARFREDNRGPKFYSNDFERGERQQEVIRAIAEKIGSWKSLPQALRILDVLTQNIKTDMNKPDMITLAKTFYDSLSGQSIVSLPFKGYWKAPYVRIDDSDLDQLKAEFQSTN